MKKHIRSSRLILAALILIGASLACSLTGEDPTEGGVDVEDAVGTSVAETLAAQSSEESPPPSESASTEAAPAETIPAPTEETSLCNPPDIVYQGISFCYDPSLATSITPETIPAFDCQDCPGGSVPEHIQFSFMGYPLADTFHEAQIKVFPVDGYAAVNPYTVDIVANLQTLLASQPGNPESIPFLPLWNAAQFMQAQVGYFDFQNGSGARFLSMYGQAAGAVNNNELFYTYQGLTDDGRYYISAVLPISHPSLPATSPMDLGADFYENFETYIADAEIQLNGHAENTFAPTIQLLDEMMQSFTITAP